MTAEAIQPAPLWPVSVDWMCGGGCMRFKTAFRFGKSGVHQVHADIKLDAFFQAVDQLRANPTQVSFDFDSDLRRGKRTVKIQVDRGVLLEIAEAIGTTRVVDDAGHYFNHWARKGITADRPCSTCPEVREAALDRAKAQRKAFMATWAKRFETTEDVIVVMLAGWADLQDGNP